MRATRWMGSRARSASGRISSFTRRKDTPDPREVKPAVVRDKDLSIRPLPLAGGAASVGNADHAAACGGSGRTSGMIPMMLESDRGRAMRLGIFSDTHANLEAL